MKVIVNSKQLYSRDSANSLFETIEKNNETRTIVDFSKVQTISRSFAQQYLLRKNASNKFVTETNIPENVKKMLVFVENNKNKPRFEEMKQLVVQILN
jgi:hypothetical protein